MINYTNKRKCMEEWSIRGYHSVEETMLKFGSHPILESWVERVRPYPFNIPAIIEFCERTGRGDMAPTVHTTIREIPDCLNPILMDMIKEGEITTLPYGIDCSANPIRGNHAIGGRDADIPEEEEHPVFQDSGNRPRENWSCDGVHSPFERAIERLRDV